MTTNPFLVRDIVKKRRRDHEMRPDPAEYEHAPAFEVVNIGDHCPVDGRMEIDAICYLSDGSWEFHWNLFLWGRP